MVLEMMTATAKNMWEVLGNTQYDQQEAGTPVPRETPITKKLLFKFIWNLLHYDVRLRSCWYKDFWHLFHRHPWQEGGLLLDKTANHFFLFAQRRGVVWNIICFWLCWKKITKTYLLFMLAFNPGRHPDHLWAGWRYKLQTCKTPRRRFCTCERVHILHHFETEAIAGNDCREQTQVSSHDRPILIYVYCICFIFVFHWTLASFEITLASN